MRKIHHVQICLFVLFSVVAQGVAFAQTPEVTVAVQSSALPHDLTVWGMFAAADPVVKAVMLVLLAASMLTWIILIAKTIELTMARRKARSAVEIILQAPDLAQAVAALTGKSGAGTRLILAAAQEVHRSNALPDGAGREGLKERVTSVLSRIEQGAGRQMAQGTGILATIGSISPFVGLFGTVWGIMHSFISISQSKTTNLAVVAPGIAEALLATAIGLVAAIPAVVVYNMFARSVTGYRHILIDAAAGIERLVSRDLDFRAAGRQTAE